MEKGYNYKKLRKMEGLIPGGCSSFNDYDQNNAGQNKRC
jgi:hypothetical protein